MQSIPTEMIAEISGDALRGAPQKYSDQIKHVIGTGKVVLVRGYLDRDAVHSVRETAVALNRAQPATEGKLIYRDGCDDIHNREAPQFRFRDRIRAKLERGSLRFRRFHGYKLFLWNKHDDHCDQAIHDIILLRNRLYGAEPDFAVDMTKGFFTMVCVQHYERGGGYLTEHSDANFHARQGLVTHFEIITLLSKKGVDYDEGGLFVRLNGRKVSVDDFADPGDLVIYDVKQPHGCAAVDAGEVADPEGRRGRWIMLVPPYSVADFLVT